MKHHLNFACKALQRNVPLRLMVTKLDIVVPQCAFVKCLSQVLAQICPRAESPSAREAKEAQAAAVSSILAERNSGQQLQGNFLCRSCKHQKDHDEEPGIKVTCFLGGFKNASLRDMIRGDFRLKIRVTGQKWELQAKNQRYSWVEPPNPNRITQRKGPNRF